MKLEKLIVRAKKYPVIIIVGIVLIILSSIITISEGGSILLRYYQETVGYKHQLQEEIYKLSAETNIDYFKSILGGPVFVNGLSLDKREYIFVNQYFYAQVITDKEGKSLAYSITTRSKDFNPKITLLSGGSTYEPSTGEEKSSELSIFLGKTNFSELDQLFGEPIYFTYVGAHNFFYSEEYSFGNPGNYQSFIFSINESGYLDIPEIPDSFFEFQPKQSISSSDHEVERFRSGAEINTFTITAPFVKGEDFLSDADKNRLGGFIFGPDYNQVRILKNSRDYRR